MKNGFALIELMVVVAIIGILAAIALPSYHQYLERSRRTVAQGQLLEEAQRLERHFLKNGSYETANLAFSASPPNGTPYYTMSLEAETPDTYLITAKPVGAQSNDACGVLSVDQAGGRTPESCWK